MPRAGSIAGPGRPTAVRIRVAATACARYPDSPNPMESKMFAAPPDVKAPPADATRTASGLAYKILSGEGDGTTPGPTDKVTVHYTGWMTNGQMFDSSMARGQTATFGLNQVIPGWTEGLQLMSPGQTARFWIPGEMAYGNTPQGNRPHGMLVFDVELFSFIEGPKPPSLPEDVGGIPDGATVTASGLAYRVLQEGTGSRKPTARSTVTVHYSGWMTDGTLFDSSVMRGETISFPLNRVIPRLDRGPAAHGRGPEEPVLDPGRARLRQRAPGQPPLRHARVRRGAVQLPVALRAHVPETSSDNFRLLGKHNPGVWCPTSDKSVSRALRSWLVSRTLEVLWAFRRVMPSSRQDAAWVWWKRWRSSTRALRAPGCTGCGFRRRACACGCPWPERRREEAVRPPMSADEAEEVLEVVGAQAAPKERANWNRRQRRYRELLMSNEPRRMAELLGELAAVRKVKALSFGERTLFETVRDLLLAELEVAANAHLRLQELLQPA